MVNLTCPKLLGMKTWSLPTDTCVHSGLLALAVLLRGSVTEVSEKGLWCDSQWTRKNGKSLILPFKALGFAFFLLLQLLSQFLFLLLLFVCSFVILCFWNKSSLDDHRELKNLATIHPKTEKEHSTRIQVDLQPDNSQSECWDFRQEVA